MSTEFCDFQSIKIFMSHVGVHQKAILAEEGINTQVNKITYSGYKFALPACSAFPRFTTADLYIKCFTHHLAFHSALLLNRKLIDSK